MHSEWECKLILPLWKTMQRLLQKFKQHYHTIQQPHCWAFIQRKQRQATGEMSTRACPLPCYSQQPRHGNSLSGGKLQEQLGSFGDLGNGQVV